MLLQTIAVLVAKAKGSFAIDRKTLPYLLGPLLNELPVRIT
jgi:hypothetical protein